MNRAWGLGEWGDLKEIFILWSLKAVRCVLFEIGVDKFFSAI